MSIGEIGTLVGMTLTLVTGIVWAVRLEGKVLAHEELDEQREEQRAVQHSDIKNALTRIESKMDTTATAAAEAAKAAAIAMALLQRTATPRRND